MASSLVRDSIMIATSALVTESGEPLGAQLARNAEEFARRRLTPARVHESFFTILTDLEPYRAEDRVWTIRVPKAPPP
jgi:hypothetical protein